MKDLGVRVFSGVLGLLFLIFVIIKGGLLLSFSIFVISTIGLLEFYKAMRSMSYKPILIIGLIGNIFMFLSTIYSSIGLDLIITLLIILSLAGLLFKKDLNLGDVAVTILGFIYVPFMLFHISFLDGTKYIWLIFIIAFGTDTFAYFVGSLLGRHKLCPSISPNKSVEGAVGGILGSLILVIVYSIFFKIEPIWLMSIMSVIASILSQMGDLVASRMKRLAKIKDFGKLIPGHGGIIDRFDSIIFTSPVIYYFISHFITG